MTYDKRYPYIEFYDGECNNLINYKVNYFLTGNIKKLKKKLKVMILKILIKL